jgi:hypothetical protein
VFAVVVGAAAAFFGDLLVLLILVNGDVVRPVFALAGLPWFVTGILAARNGLAPQRAAQIGFPPRRLPLSRRKRPRPSRAKPLPVAVPATKGDVP